ncbi:uncharacterized protein LOC125238028 [Leguminivora glycinivorella]|uniref:uncharacterized protein LOC125238028 n=1 Tax=Leguminivora glycinivorella TaxID=1035111 RepID=UPI002010763F|nr:uncharacterized protein LOC125238028 [Leguminivora glycinivorella]
MDSCRCCLQCPPDKDLTTPYIHLGKTEIYLEMLQDCFDIKLPMDGSGSCGICSACVGRLRDASDFKLQVQRSQAELPEVALIKVENAKTELFDVAEEDNSVSSMLCQERLRSDEGGTISPERKTYACEHCQKSYRKRSTLNKHKEKIHQIYRPPPTTACGFWTDQTLSEISPNVCASHPHRTQPYWWSSKIAELRTASNKARRAYTRCRRRRHTAEEEDILYTAYKAAKEILKAEIARRKVEVLET